jgi:hypothetical protein
MQKVLIEKTSKPIKAKLPLGQVLLTFGVLLLFAAIIGAGTLIPAAILIAVGMLITYVASVQRWWHHE